MTIKKYTNRAKERTALISEKGDIFTVKLIEKDPYDLTVNWEVGNFEFTDFYTADIQARNFTEIWQINKIYI